MWDVFKGSQNQVRADLSGLPLWAGGQESVPSLETGCAHWAHYQDGMKLAVAEIASLLASTFTPPDLGLLGSAPGCSFLGFRSLGPQRLPWSTAYKNNAQAPSLSLL